MKEDIKIYLSLVVIVILIIIGILAIKNFINPDIDGINEETMKCIASKAVIYSQSGCGHCENQKAILGNYYGLFTDINCLNERDKCAEAGITATPTWVIDNKRYEGTKSTQELKNLTGC